MQCCMWERADPTVPVVLGGLHRMCSSNEIDALGMSFAVKTYVMSIRKIVPCVSPRLVMGADSLDRGVESSGMKPVKMR